jgi:hypothetical protein
MSETYYGVSHEEQCFSGGKEIGIIRSVNATKFLNVTDKSLTDDDKSALRYAQDLPNRTYNVELLTRPSRMYNSLPAYLGKNDVSILEIGDLVLIDYLGENKQPFIMQTINEFHGYSMMSGQTPTIPGPGERIIQTSAKNFVYWRNDGGIMVRSFSPGNMCELLLGGGQGLSQLTGYQLVASLRDDNGPILHVDSNGTLCLHRTAIEMTSVNGREQCGESKTVDVGVDATTSGKDGRVGTYNLNVYKDRNDYVATEYVLEVGDAKDDEPAIVNAKMSQFIAQKFSLVVGDNKATDESGRKLVLTMDSNNDTQKKTFDVKVGDGNTIHMDSDGVFSLETTKSIDLKSQNITLTANSKISLIGATNELAQVSGGGVYSIARGDILEQIVGLLETVVDQIALHVHNITVPAPGSPVGPGLPIAVSLPLLRASISALKSQIKSMNNKVS